MFGYIIALIAGTLTALFVGSLWYSPLLFGEQWMKLSKLTPKKIEQNGTSPMIGATLMALLRSIVLCLLFVLLLPGSAIEAMSYGLILWFGFAAPEHVHGVIWECKAKELLYINAFCSLAMIITQSIIIWYVLDVFSVALVV